MRRLLRILLNVATLVSLTLFVSMVVLVCSGARNTILRQQRLPNGDELWVTGQCAAWVGPPETPVLSGTSVAYPRRFIIYYGGGIALTAILPLVRGIALIVGRAFKPQPPPDPSRCAACGYDLRATPTRCPECGQSPP
jgi:hypothetical protein